VSLLGVLGDASRDGLAVAPDHLTVVPHDYVVNLLCDLRVERIALVDAYSVAWVRRISPSCADSFLGGGTRSPPRRHLRRSCIIEPPSRRVCGNNWLRIDKFLQFRKGNPGAGSEFGFVDP
jgi:hypothetical protein